MTDPYVAEQVDAVASMKMRQERYDTLMDAIVRDSQFS